MGADLIFSKMSLNCIQEMILLHHSTALIKKSSGNSPKKDSTVIVSKIGTIDGKIVLGKIERLEKSYILTDIVLI